MPPRIAIPVPTSFDPEYNDRSWPQYARAVERAGGIPVRIPLDDAPAATAKLIDSCTGVLLPGSGADVNPQKYGQPLHPAAAPPDPARENVDELLLQDAHNMGKPLLAICFGTQILNVWRGGSLVQDLESALPSGPINHRAGRDVVEAHTVDIAPHSLLAALLTDPEPPNNSLGINDLAPKGPAPDPAATNSSVDLSRTRDGLSFRPESRSDGAEKPASAPAHPASETHSPSPSPTEHPAGASVDPATTNSSVNPAADLSRTRDGLSFRPESRSDGAEKPASAPAHPAWNTHSPSPSPTEHPAGASAHPPFLQAPVNSSHHQAIEAPGDGLFIAARSSADGVIEAVEGGHGLSGHDPAFLLGLQWHPERTYDESPLSRAIFHRLTAAAAAWTSRPVTTSVG